MTFLTTPMGNIGSKVLAGLLKTDEKLRVIVHDPAKLSEAARARAEIIVSSLDNADKDERSVRDNSSGRWSKRSFLW